MPAILGAAGGELALGDAAWERRAEGAEAESARAGPILAAVDHYERALEADPGNPDARIGLLRALHFAGRFVTPGETDAEAMIARGREVADAGLAALPDAIGPDARLDELAEEEIARRVDASGLSRERVARLYFWSAILWGAWSQQAGLLTAVREGVANRLHHYGLVAAALEPGYDDGGALRLLGRLHAEMPKVPFVSGWVERDRAVPLLERAYAIAPEHPGNVLLLAITLLDLAPERRDEALELLDRAARLRPRPRYLVEDRYIRLEARERFQAETGVEAPAR